MGQQNTQPMKLYLVARISGWRRTREVVMVIVCAASKNDALQIAQECMDTSDAVATELVPGDHAGIVYKQHGQVVIAQ